MKNINPHVIPGLLRGSIAPCVALPPEKWTMDIAIEWVNKELGVDCMIRTRRREIVDARMLAVWFINKHITTKQKLIAEKIGYTESSVWTYIQRVDHLRVTNRAFKINNQNILQYEL